MSYLKTDNISGMSVDQAVSTILSHIQTIENEERPLLEAVGQVSAEDIYSQINVPDWDSSAMDGFAVKAADIQGAGPQNPCILQVIETVMAGSIARHEVTPGKAIRIMTGAPIPAGADCVVGFEYTDVDVTRAASRKNPPAKVGILRAEVVGANIYPAGVQVKKDQLMLGGGAILGPSEVGILAALGLTRAKVIRRPVVAIIATGSELVAPGKPLSKPFIYAGSSYSLAARVQSCGGIPLILGIARDKKSSLIAKIRRGMKADMIISTGGVSMGDHDLVKGILAQMGEIVFEQVRMVPGKAAAFALLATDDSLKRNKRIPHFALSGNPTASLVGFEVLVRPAIARMSGRINFSPPTVQAIMENPIRSNTNRRYVWVAVEKRDGRYFARFTNSDARGVLPSIEEANGLAVIPESSRRVADGDTVQVSLLDWR